MMTKFILVGGYVQKALDGGRAFCEELVKDFSEPVKILDCMFARLPTVWEETFAKDKEFFLKQLPGKKLEFQLADLDTFISQVQWADAVYLRGGSSEELVKSLLERNEWSLDIEGKTVAGTSAGADALSKYYYGLDNLEVRRGFGLVPIKMIPHFKSDYHGWEFDWDKAEAELKAYKEDLPLVALREGEFKVFER